MFSSSSARIWKGFTARRLPDSRTRAFGGVSMMRSLCSCSLLYCTASHGCYVVLPFFSPYHPSMSKADTKHPLSSHLHGFEKHPTRTADPEVMIRFCGYRKSVSRTSKRLVTRKTTSDRGKQGSVTPSSRSPWWSGARRRLGQFFPVPRYAMMTQDQVCRDVKYTRSP